MTKVRPVKLICRASVIFGIVVLAGCNTCEADSSTPAEIPTAASGPAIIDDTPPARLTGGAGSLDELVTQFLEALTQKDKDRLRSLRITEEEYRDGIVPWNVEPGKPVQRIRREVVDYFWGTINGKSVVTEASLLLRYGGKKLTLKNRTDQGEIRYAGFKATKRLRLHVAVEGEEEEQEIATGSAAEVGGRFKFVSIQRD